jgi:hypothetical protein
MGLDHFNILLKMFWSLGIARFKLSNSVSNLKGTCYRLIVLYSNKNVLHTDF